MNFQKFYYEDRKVDNKWSLPINYLYPEVLRAQIENGNNNPSTDVIIRMLKVFDLPDDLKEGLR
jgi:hypothetical protein